MCGIAGLWSAPGAERPRPDEIDAMVHALHHRGPDGHGAHLDGPIGLGHARLSIIDLAGGAQPLANEDDTVWVTFNGEIFNYIELRADLVRRGHRFRTQSDTEVLVHLYEEHGDAFVEHLNGQFAIALWDGRQQRLVLARDRVGIRPLFYADAGGRFAFASEVKALFTLPALSRRFDAAGLASTFSYWAPLGDGTVFAGVRQLPPGHVMTIDASGRRQRRYWDWAFDGQSRQPRDDRELEEELRELLRDAVRLQLRADVPVGAYLSGGLDSSIITTLIAGHDDVRLRTFSLTFEDAEFDESAHQHELVVRLRTDHSSVQATRAGIARQFARTVWHAEVPLVRTAPTPMMVLADSVRAAGHKVVLTGEGADEAFGGYDLFKEAALRRFVARGGPSSRRSSLLGRLYPYLAHSPTTMRQLSAGYFGSGLDRVDNPGFAHAMRLATTRRTLQFFNRDWRDRLAGWDADAALQRELPPDFARWQPLERDQYIEAKTLMSGYLLAAQGDRMAMAASIEARFPFLDHRVIEFACRLPPRLKLRALREKVLLKRAFADQLPKGIVARSKQPYRAPDSTCFFADGRPLPWVAELLNTDALRRAELFDPVSVGKLIEKCRAGRAIGFGDNMAFVGVLSTMLLHQQFIAAGAPVALAH
jgi:asparagine synthase (glutamine-hydrolysing)